MAISPTKIDLTPFISKIDYSMDALAYAANDMAATMNVYAKTLGANLANISTYDCDSPIGADNNYYIKGQGTTATSRPNYRYEHLNTIDNIIAFNNYIVRAMASECPEIKDVTKETTSMWDAYAQFANYFGQVDSYPKNSNYSSVPVSPMSGPTGQLMYMDFFNNQWPTHRDCLEVYLIGDPDMIDYLNTTPGILVHELEDVTKQYQDNHLTKRDFNPTRLRFKAQVAEPDDIGDNFEEYARREQFILSTSVAYDTYHATRVMDIRPSEKLYRVSLTLSKDTIRKVFNRNVNYFVPILLSDDIAWDSPLRMTMKSFADFLS